MSTRNPLSTALSAVGLFVVGAIAFQKLAEDLADAGGLRTALTVAAASSLLALGVAVAPTARALARSRDRRAWLLMTVPALGVVACGLAVKAALALSAGHGVHSAANLVAVAIAAGVGIGALGAAVRASAAVVQRLTPEQDGWLRPAALIALAAGMGATTLLALAWGLAVLSKDPTAFHGNGGLVATPFVSSWIATVVLLATATALASTAGRREWTALT